MIDREIKLIGIDLDGTLLTDEKQLCEGAEETLLKAREKGIHIVPITGRPFLGVPECVRALPSVEYFICSNGASIIDAKTKEKLYDFSMSNEKSIEVFDALKGSKCIFEPFCDGVCYTEQEILDSYIGYFRGSPIEEYLLSTRVVIDSIEAIFKEQNKRADEFFISCENAEAQKEVSKKLDALGGVQYWYYDKRYIEATREGCDKGSALEAICIHLGVDIVNTMAFGDGDNDLFFLEKAGIAVAMENAFESVKEKADIIAESNNDNGVCKLIETLL